MDNLGKHFHFLNLLYNTHPRQQKALLESASLQQISAICEILLNIVNGTIELNNDVKKFMNKRQAVIFRLLNKSLIGARKRRILKRNIPLLKLILHSITGFINNESNASKTHTNTRREIQSHVQELEKSS